MKTGARKPILVTPWASRFVGCLFLSVCWSGCADERLPDPPAKAAPSASDLMDFHRQRALSLDSLIAAQTASWGAAVTTGTGIRYEVLERSTTDAIPIESLPEGLVLELHHRISLLDGREISSWTTDGPMAFELDRTDLPLGFHDLIRAALLGDSIRAMIPPSQAWGMSGRAPEIPQEAVISVHMRMDRYIPIP